jgi:uncharacterized protein (DUF58 family)
VTDGAIAGGPPGAPGDAPLLDPSVLARLERLQLGTRRRLAGRFTGEHRSVRTGSSLEFVDEREYVPGDDERRIDHQLWARTGLLFVRLFEAEDDITVRLLVDTSASMGIGAKARQAARLAAAVGFVALTRRDAVTVHSFPGGGLPRRFTGRSASRPLFDHLARLPTGGGTDVVAAAMEVLTRPGPRGVTVLLSDLLTPGWADAVDRLPARGDAIVVVHVLAREELDPDLHGDVDLVDAETGERVPVSLSAAALARYREGVAAWREEVAGRVRRAGATYVAVVDDDDVEGLLLGAWHDAGVLR